MGRQKLQYKHHFLFEIRRAVYTYKILCEYLIGIYSSYIGTKRPLSVRIKRLHENTIRGEKEKSGAAAHSESIESKIVGREQNYQKSNEKS